MFGIKLISRINYRIIIELKLTAITNKPFRLFCVVHWAHDTADDKGHLSDNQNCQQNNLCLKREKQCENVSI